MDEHMNGQHVVVSFMPETLIGLAQEHDERGVHPAVVYLAELSDGSKRTMSESLTSMARLLTGSTEATYLIAWWKLSVDHVKALRAILRDRYKAATANKMLSALRGVLKVCWQQERITAEVYQRLKDVKSIQGDTIPAGREIKPGELAALLYACEKDGSLAGRRDAALFALLYVCGLRRAEVAALTLADWHPDTQGLHLTGKRNKQRIVYVADPGAFAALSDWLDARGRYAGPLFARLHKGGGRTTHPLTPQGVYHILQKRATETGLAHLSPHDFRRTFVGDLLEHGADIATVQKLAGHATVNTTARYDRRGEQTKRSTAALLHVPYQRQE